MYKHCVGLTLGEVNGKSEIFRNVFTYSTFKYELLTPTDNRLLAIHHLQNLLTLLDTYVAKH